MKVVLLLVFLLSSVLAKEITLKEMKDEQRIAFIIENVNYEGAANSNNIDEVDGIKNFFEANGFQVIYQKNSSRADTIRSFRTFNVKMEKGGIAFFYFRGHVVQLNNINYLLPVNVISHASNFSKILSINAIIKIMNRANNRINFLVIDSVENIKISKSLHIQKKGLAKLKVKSNTNLIISSKINTTRKTKNFTKQLQRIFLEKGLLSRDGFTAFERKNKGAYVQLSKQDFYFKLPPKLLNAEDKFWKKSLELSTIASLSLYLQHYSRGKYKSKARNSIKEIEIKKAELQMIKAQELSKIKEEADIKAKFDAEVQRQVSLELAKITQAKEKKLSLPNTKVSKKIKVYKPSAYLEPKMVRLVSTSNLKSFSIGKYEVSNKEYKVFLQATQSNKNLLMYDRREDEPIINVTFQEAKEYALWLSAMSGKKYSLPTQLQWEYAARAGSKTKYFWGDKDVSMKKAFWLKNRVNNAHLYAWIKSNASEQLHNIGEKEQNPWGLYDVYGNANEWCINVDNNEDKQVLKGGSFLSNSEGIRSGISAYRQETYKSKDLGFRLVKEI
ncbi:SUMF1/EgtB/PvdO family nonheme iron enzyme [Sulfurimonas sp. MAG313]|nr:SUMF1/EgtB/PvdO family nonheme iron enzyme [Sulfurimonas sp. MAG313]MDF1880308.1 SUMF1/EgtB/PvdO family nonheme iron enzyme [Sulfurimonas sp. MAG313]